VGNLSYCPCCGAFVENHWDYCQKCGKYLRGLLNVSETPVYVGRKKDPMIALLLALIPGLFGIWGIGHFYVEEFGKGILLLFLGLILAFIMILNIICGLIILIIGFFIWLWQGYDAYSIAKDTQISYRYY
jgi:TM2 domain-containing membrane protein YozV